MTSDPHQSRVSITVYHPRPPAGPAPTSHPPGLVSSMWLSGITTCTSTGIGPRRESAPESLASASEAPKSSPVATLSSSPSDPDCKLALLISGISCQLGAMESFLLFALWGIKCYIFGLLHVSEDIFIHCKCTRLHVLHDYDSSEALCVFSVLCLHGAQLAVCVNWMLQAPGCS